MKKIIIYTILALSAISITNNIVLAQSVFKEETDEDFLDGTFSSTTISGVGSSAYIHLSSFTIEWWNANWRYRRVLYVFNFVNKKLNDYQVLFTTNTQVLIQQGKMKIDCSDVRFVAEDNRTVLPHFIESGANTTKTKFWIKISTLPAGSIENPSYVKIYMYYGNPTATSASNPRAVFDVYEDFSTNPRTSGYWDIYDRGDQTYTCVWNQTAQNFSLTKANTNRAGAIFVKDYQLPTDISWQAKFRYQVTNYNSQPDGGEGFTFMFYKQKFAPGSYPDYGMQLGFTSGGSVPGYGIEFDAIWSGETGGEGTGRDRVSHFALIKDNVTPHLVEPGGVVYYSDNVRDEKWYTCIVTFTNYTSSSNILVTTIDQLDNWVDRINYTGVIDKTYRSVGFSAATGSQVNEHIIDDFILRKYVTPEPVVVDIGEDPKDFYYAYGQYTSAAYNCGAPAVISSVTWTADVPQGTWLDIYVFGSSDTINYNWIKLEKDKELNILTNGTLIQYAAVFYSTVAFLLRNSEGIECLGIRETPKLYDITFYYRTRSAPIINVSTFTFLSYNWETNEYVMLIDFSGSYDLDGRIERWMIDYGDGETETFFSSNPVVIHTYYTIPTSSYTYTITTYTLTAYAFDNDGFFTFLNIQIPLYAVPEILTIPPEEVIPPPKYYPVAVISGGDKVVRVNEPVVFDASESYDIDGDIIAYGWWFGDYDTSFSTGTKQEAEVVSHTYVDIGTFTVYLFVLDNDYLQSSTTIKVVVRGYPKAIISSSKNVIKDKTITVGYSEPIELDGRSSVYPNGSIIKYEWDLGDGTKISSQVVSHIYSSVTSSYNVVLTVYGDDGLTSSDSIRIIVSARPQISAIVPIETYSGEEVYFDASASVDIDGSITSYVWSFGDGSTANGKVVSHVYNKPGVYTVTLVVTDNFGLTSSKEYKLTVKQNLGKLEEMSVLNKEKINIYPVPFRLQEGNSLNFSYYIEEDADVYVSIYDMFGRQVKNFKFVKNSDGARKGWNNLVWDCLDSNNQKISSGVYICKILIVSNTKKVYKTEKFVVIR